jgi:hypothetical protein
MRPLERKREMYFELFHRRDVSVDPKRRRIVKCEFDRMLPRVRQTEEVC